MSPGKQYDNSKGTEAYQVGRSETFQSCQCSSVQSAHDPKLIISSQLLPLLWPVFPHHVQMSSLRFSCFCLRSGATVYLHLHLRICRLRFPRCLQHLCARAGQTDLPANAADLFVALQKPREFGRSLNTMVNLNSRCDEYSVDMSS